LGTGNLPCPSVCHKDAVGRWLWLANRRSRKLQFAALLRPPSRRQIVGAPIFDVSMYRAFGMISCIFATLNGGSFQRLIGVGKFCHAFLRRIFNLRKLLQISGLSGAVWPDLVASASQIVESRLIIAT
jgi:hypothetical protein